LASKTLLEPIEGDSTPDRQLPLRRSLQRRSGLREPTLNRLEEPITIASRRLCLWAVSQTQGVLGMLLPVENHSAFFYQAVLPKNNVAFHRNHGAAWMKDAAWLPMHEPVLGGCIECVYTPEPMVIRPLRSQSCATSTLLPTRNASTLSISPRSFTINPMLLTWLPFLILARVE
jgi:hypothetical protein